MAKENNLRHKSTPAIDIIEQQDRHFTTLAVKNFRCFKDFSMDSFERINLIGGKNNVGKTALLEALFLLLGATNASLVLKINAFRGLESFEGDAASISEVLWSHLFYNFDDRAPITLVSELESGKEITVTLKQMTGGPTTLPLGESIQGNATLGSRGSTQALQLQYKDTTGKSGTVKLQVDAKGIHVPTPLIEPLFTGIFLSARRRPSPQENSARYGQLELSGSPDKLLEALQIVEPRLRRLSTIVSGGIPMLYGDIGLGRMLPLAMMGDGLGETTSLLLAISSAQGGVVLIDEIENGLHYSILTKVWRAIAETARSYHTQVFATTHSWECIKAAHEAFSTNGIYDFRYHRLQQTKDVIEAISLDQEMLATTLEAGWEIR